MIITPRCPDPNSLPPVALCRLCGGELYDGDALYLIDGAPVCPDCLPGFAADYFSDRLTTGDGYKLILEELCK